MKLNLEREWQELRVHLARGGATDNQLGAMRAAFFCGAHACVAVLSRGGDAAEELVAELKRELHGNEAALRRASMH